MRTSSSEAGEAAALLQVTGADPAVLTQVRGGEVRGHTEPHPVPAHRTCPAFPPRPTHLAQRVHTGVHEAGPKQLPQCSGGLLFPGAPHSVCRQHSHPRHVCNLRLPDTALRDHASRRAEHVTRAGQSEYSVHGTTQTCGRHVTRVSQSEYSKPHTSVTGQTGTRDQAGQSQNSMPGTSGTGQRHVTGACQSEYSVPGVSGTGQRHVT